MKLRSLWILLLIPVLAFAQEGSPSPVAEAPAAEETPVAVSATSIEAQIQEIEKTADLDPAIRAKALELYRQALDQLQAARKWESQTRDLAAGRAGAPTLLARYKKELGHPAPTVKLSQEPGATVEHYEQLLSAATAEGARVEKHILDLETEKKRRLARRQEVPTLVADQRQLLEDTEKQLVTPPIADENPLLARARSVSLQASRRAIEKQIDALEEELLSYEARGELLTARRDIAARRLTVVKSRVEKFQEILNILRKKEAEKAVALAQQANEQQSDAHPAVRSVAEVNEGLARERTGSAGLADRITELEKSTTELQARLTGLRDDFTGLQQRIRTVGLTESMALLLRKRKAELPSIWQHQQNMWQRHEVIAEVQLKLIELEEQRGDLADLDRRVEEILLEIGPVPEEDLAGLDEDLRRNLTTQRELLDGLIGDYNSYFLKLVDLDAVERNLIEAARQYTDYIDGHILWVRSAPAVGIETIKRTIEATRWIFRPAHFTQAGTALARDMRVNPVPWTLVILVTLVLFVLRRRFLAKIQEVAARIGEKGYIGPFHPTVSVLVYTLFLSAPGAFLLWGIGWRMGAAPMATEYAQAFAKGLRAVALVYWMLAFFRSICRRQGLAEAHFRWRAATLSLIRRSVIVLEVTLLPVVMIIQTLEAQPNDLWKGSLGRLVFIFGMLVVAAVARRCFDPAHGFLEQVTASPGGILERAKPMIHGVAVGTPVVLAVLVSAGYYYTAMQLARQFFWTAGFLASIGIANAMLVRWLYLTRARFAMEQARQRHSGAAEGAEGAAHAGAESIPLPAAGAGLELSDINAQSRQMIRWLVIIVTGLGLWMIWADVVSAFSILDRWTLWYRTTRVMEAVTTPEGDIKLEEIRKVVPVTLSDLALAMLIVAITVVATRNIPGLLEVTLLKRLPLDAGGRYAVATVTRYLIIVFGVIVAFWGLGVGWANVQWLAAAVTVGLGFGLQEIFANFVSGLIILFEAPIRVGDVVTIGEISGTVTRIRIRATVITGWDRKELIVPNREFITGRVINWTLSDPMQRVTIAVGVSYQSDPRKVHDILMDIATSQEHVLTEPPPSVFFVTMGESALNFELKVFVASLDVMMKVQDAINTAVIERFAAAGVEIAYPQRDLNLRTTEPLQVTMREAAPAAVREPSGADGR